MTPLHLAALQGYKEIAALLISRGADVNARDSSNLSPLYYAIEYRYTELAELLRRHGGVE